MKIATVLDNSDPVSMILRQRGMISVDKRKFITSELSFCYKGLSHGGLIREKEADLD